MSLLCASPRCRVPGRHTGDCDDEQCPQPRRHSQDCKTQHCRGCQPATAADGLALCPHCTARIGRDAVESARLWYEIGEILSAGGSNGTPVSNPHPGLVLNVRGAETRAEIRHVLASWCKLVAEERGLGLPRDESQHALGSYIRRHEQWLAATEYAGEVADELAALRSRAWSAAYPEGVSIVEIGTCPELGDEGEPCAGTVRAVLRRAEDRHGNVLPSKVVCDADSTHEWTSERWRVLGRALGKLWDMHARPDVVSVAYGIPIADVYRAAHRAAWRTVREGRRVLYDTRDVVATLGT